MVDNIQRQFTELEHKLVHYNAEINKLKETNKELKRRYVYLLMQHVYMGIFTCTHPVCMYIHTYSACACVGLQYYAT